MTQEAKTRSFLQSSLGAGQVKPFLCVPLLHIYCTSWKALPLHLQALYTSNTQSIVVQYTMPSSPPWAINLLTRPQTFLVVSGWTESTVLWEWLTYCLHWKISWVFTQSKLSELCSVYSSESKVRNRFHTCYIATVKFTQKVLGQQQPKGPFNWP